MSRCMPKRTNCILLVSVTTAQPRTHTLTPIQWLIDCPLASLPQRLPINFQIRPGMCTEIGVPSNAGQEAAPCALREAPLPAPSAKNALPDVNFIKMNAQPQYPACSKAFSDRQTPKPETPAPGMDSPIRSSPLSKKCPGPTIPSNIIHWARKNLVHPTSVFSAHSPWHTQHTVAPLRPPPATQHKESTPNPIAAKQPMPSNVLRLQTPQAGNPHTHCHHIDCHVAHLSAGKSPLPLTPEQLPA
jgi:hypothetical protein